MKRLLDKVESRTEEVLKKHCEEWLSCEVTTLEKAFPYLPSTLMALLAAKVNDEESAGEVLTFLEEHNFNGKWAQKPEELLEKWMNEDNKVVPTLERSYEYLMGDYKSTALDQLESTGDLKRWQLKRLLPFLSAILLSSLAEWESEEQADQKDLLTFLREHYEEVKRSTPSKLMEILKKDAAFAQLAEKEKEEEDEEDGKVALPSYKSIVFYLSGIIVVVSLLLWINYEEIVNNDRIKNRRSAPQQEQRINYRLWQLKDDQTLKLENDDPLNKLVERLVGIQADSVNKFYLREVSWQDTLLPDYYNSTIDHLQKLHRSYPDLSFHINIKVSKQKDESNTVNIGEKLRNTLRAQMPELIASNIISYSIDVSKTDTWTPELNDELVLQAQMQWIITIRV